MKIKKYIFNIIISFLCIGSITTSIITTVNTNKKYEKLKKESNISYIENSNIDNVEDNEFAPYIQEINQLKTTIDEQQKIIDENSSTINEYKSTINTQSQSIKNLETKINELNVSNKISDLDTRIKEIEDYKAFVINVGHKYSSWYTTTPFELCIKRYPISLEDERCI